MAPKNPNQRKSLYPNLRLDPVDFSYSDNTSENEEIFFDRPKWYCGQKQTFI